MKTVDRALFIKCMQEVLQAYRKHVENLARVPYSLNSKGKMIKKITSMSSSDVVALYESIANKEANNLSGAERAFIKELSTRAADIYVSLNKQTNKQI